MAWCSEIDVSDNGMTADERAVENERLRAETAEMDAQSRALDFQHKRFLDAMVRDELSRLG